MPMHVVHVVRDLDCASGGPSRTIPALARSVSQQNPEICATVLYQDRGLAMSVDAAREQRVRFRPIAAARRATVLSDALAEIHAATPITLAHLHGLWSPTLHASARRCDRLGIPYVVSPRGMLSQACLSVKRLRKTLAWSMYQRRDLQHAATIHATSEAERDDCQRCKLTPPIEVIPNGCELPPQSRVPVDSQSDKLPKGFPVRGDQPLAVALGRVDPVKGLDTLIDAWRASAAPQWHLVIAGPGQRRHTEALSARIAQAGLGQSVHWIGAVDECQKWALLDRAELLINASKSENFGMAIAEALASGTPVIATRGTPWENLEKNRCGWWVEGSAAGLASAIGEATNISKEQRREMGLRGRQLIVEQYSWSRVATQMSDCYQRVLGSSC